MTYDTVCDAASAGTYIDLEACPVDLPATSLTGVVILTVGLLTLGALAVRRRRV